MRKLFTTIGIGLLIGFITPPIIFSLTTVILGGEFNEITISLIRFYSAVGGLFGVIGALIGRYSSNNSVRRTWIGGLISVLIYVGLVYCLIITMPCPFAGFCQ